MVKNLPKHLKEVDLLNHFQQANSKLSLCVTDAKIMTKNNRSRQFGFVGFKTEDQAAAALKYFNKTYLHTSKLEVEYAKAQDDTTLDRPWSKHSMGSSAFSRRNPNQKDSEKDQKKRRAEKEAQK